MVWVKVRILYIFYTRSLGQLWTNFLCKSDAIGYHKFLLCAVSYLTVTFNSAHSLKSLTYEYKGKGCFYLDIPGDACRGRHGWRWKCQLWRVHRNDIQRGKFVPSSHNQGFLCRPSAPPRKQKMSCEPKTTSAGKVLLWDIFFQIYTTFDFTWKIFFYIVYYLPLN